MTTEMESRTVKIRHHGIQRYQEKIQTEMVSPTRMTRHQMIQRFRDLIQMGMEYQIIWIQTMIMMVYRTVKIRHHLIHLSQEKELSVVM